MPRETNGQKNQQPMEIPPELPLQRSSQQQKQSVTRMFEITTRIGIARE